MAHSTLRAYFWITTLYKYHGSDPPYTLITVLSTYQARTTMPAGPGGDLGKKGEKGILTGPSHQNIDIPRAYRIIHDKCHNNLVCNAL